MGIYDRDYYRGESAGLLGAWGRWGSCVWIIVVTCAVFLLQRLAVDARLPFDPTREGVYDYRLIAQGEVWRFVTPIFLHNVNDLFHVAFNMLALYWFGLRLEERYGSREFLVFYLASGVAANVGKFLVQAAVDGPTAPALGASGAVTAVLVLYALNFPHHRVLLFFVLPMPVWALVLLYVGLDLLGVLGVQKGNTDFLVHLLGALFGLCYFRLGRSLSGGLPRLGRPAAIPSRPRLRVVPMEEGEMAPPRIRQKAEEGVESHAEEPLEAMLDRVLAKVSQFGQESLSRVEREILFRASEVYKKRRK